MYEYLALFIHSTIFPLEIDFTFKCHFSICNRLPKGFKTCKNRLKIKLLPTSISSGRLNVNVFVYICNIPKKQKPPHTRYNLMH